MFLVSQFVYVMETSSRFSHSQAKAFELLQRLRQRAELKKDAAMLIKAWWKHRRVVKALKSKTEADRRNWAEKHLGGGGVRHQAKVRGRDMPNA